MKILKKYIIPSVVLLIFILVMTSGGFLKRPFSKSDDVSNYIEVLKKDAINENWKQAGEDFKKLEYAWTKVEKRVQFSVERNEMNDIDTNLGRIEGSISASDKANTIIELNEISVHWKELER